MSRRQRSAQGHVRSAQAARDKALRRRTRRRRAVTAAAAAATLAGAGASAAVVPASAVAPTTAGVAQRLAAACTTPDSDPVDLTDVEGRLFFTASDNLHGFGLWRSDGTGRHTVRLLDFPYNYGSDGRYDDFGYRGLIDVGGTLFFISKTDRVDALWRSDGTPDGTVRIKRFPDLDSRGREAGPTNMAAIGDTLFFTANDGELWKSDGTTAGTVLVRDIGAGGDDDYYYGPTNLTVVGETLYFTGDDGTGAESEELWRSDGTPGGTVVVKDIHPGDDVHDGPSRLTAFGDTLYFTADDGVHGRELWSSYGTEAGTTMVDDIAPGPESSNPSALTAFADTLFFGARGHADGSRDLWTSDGTAAGTSLVEDFGPNPVLGPGPGLGQIAVVDGTMFFAAVDQAAGLELWRSDGTGAGTVLLEDVWPGGNGGSPQSLTVLDDTLYFAADAGTGRDLWRSDGTEAGTVLVADIPVAFGYHLRLTTSGGQLFFVAKDDRGEELWASDGTAAGTRLVRDVNRGGSVGVGSRARTNARNSAARVSATFDSPGTVRVAPARAGGIKRFRLAVAGEDRFTRTLTLELTREAKRKLRRTGRVEIGARFSFTSCAGVVSSETRSYTLKKR